MRVTIDGIDFELHPADNTTEFRLYTTGAFDEPESLEALRERVHGRRARVFDIGANCGLYALTLARAAADGSLVHAFEPSPVMAARLERNVALNGLGFCVRVHRVALGATDGRALLNVHAKNHGQSSLLPLEAGVDALGVECRALLGYLDAPADAPAGVDELTLVKIDVEGHEDEVLHPSLEACPEDRPPDCLLAERVLESRWRLDLRAALAGRGDVATFEVEGNVLFEQRTDDAGIAERPRHQLRPRGLRRSPVHRRLAAEWGVLDAAAVPFEGTGASPRRDGAVRADRGPLAGARVHRRGRLLVRPARGAPAA